MHYAQFSLAALPALIGAILAPCQTHTETRRPPVKRVLSPARPLIAGRPRNAVKRWQLY
jgi:hypothetical protein